MLYFVFRKKRPLLYWIYPDALESRLKNHNSNYKGFTGKFGNWRILCNEKFDNKAAIQREKELRNWKELLSILVK